jgi:WD40 repeat protein
MRPGIGRTSGPQGYGTAFVIAPRFALTAFHCVGNRLKGELDKQPVRIAFPEREEMLADIVGGDNRLDVAVLRLHEELSERSIIKMDRKIEVGESIVAVGYPSILSQIDQPVVSGDVVTLSSIGGVAAVQLFCREAADGLPLKGLSGAPVVRQGTNVAVGIIRCNPTFADGRVFRVTPGGMLFATPFSAFLQEGWFIRICPELRPHTGSTALPPLPEHYVARREDLAELRQALTAQRTSGNMSMIALHGMGGLGKTVLAQAICRDDVVRAVFSDGIIWLSIGKEAIHRVTSLMRVVAQNFGQELAANIDDQQAADWYRRYLSDKAALIVLDDVWSVRDVDPFRAESPMSCLLITTRDGSIPTGIGAVPVEPRFLAPAEARKVLALWSGLSIVTLPAEASDLIQECGGLVLALAIIGAMLRGKPHTYWGYVLNLLQNPNLMKKPRHQVADYPYPDVFLALQVSVDALQPEIRNRYLVLAVLLEGMLIHPLIQRTLWNVGEFDALETAEEFIRLALVQRAGDDGIIRLHDLLLDYVRAKYPDPEALKLIHDAMRLSSHIIESDPTQFASQLVGRLLLYMGTPAVRDFTYGVIRGAPRPWLRPLQTFAGHVGRIQAVAVTPDGRCAISASNDNTLKVWELKSGLESQTLQGHAGRVNAVAVTPDGRRAVSASMDHTLKVWELETGRELHTLSGHTGSVRAVAVTPDGRCAISASDDHTLKVWELETGRELHTLSGHTGPVRAVAVTPDGRRAVSGCLDALKVWKLESGRELRTIKGRAGEILAAAVTVTPDSRYVVSTCKGGVLKVWELESGTCIATFSCCSHHVNAIAVTPDGRRAVSGCDAGTFKVWELERLTCIATFSCDSSAMCCTVLSDGTIVAGDSGSALYFNEIIVARYSGGLLHVFKLEEIDSELVAGQPFVPFAFRLDLERSLTDLGRHLDELLAHFGDAPELALREQIAEALVEKGATLRQLYHWDAAIAVYDELLARFGDAHESALREQVVRALVNKGATLDQLNREEEMSPVYDKLFLMLCMDPALHKQLHEDPVLHKQLEDIGFECPA